MTPRSASRAWWGRWGNLFASEAMYVSQWSGAARLSYASHVVVLPQSTALSCQVARSPSRWWNGHAGELVCIARKAARSHDHPSGEKPPLSQRQFRMQGRACANGHEWGASTRHHGN